MSDGTKREDDTLSGGSELITLCLELTHKSIAAKEEEYEPVRGGSLTVSATLRLLTLNLKKKDKGIPRLVAPSLEIKSWDEQKQVGGVGGKMMNHQAVFFYQQLRSAGGRKRGNNKMCAKRKHWTWTSEHAGTFLETFLCSLKLNSHILSTHTNIYWRLCFLTYVQKRGCSEKELFFVCF